VRLPNISHYVTNITLLISQLFMIKELCMYVTWNDLEHLFSLNRIRYDSRV